MTYVIRRRPPEGPEIFWMGRDINGDFWTTSRPDACVIAGQDDAHEEALRLSEIFDGEMSVWAVDNTRTS